MSVENDVIDSDHKYLIDIINSIEHSINNKNLDQLRTDIERLGQYSRTHFTREEKIARAVGYEQVKHLRLSHDALMNELNKVTRTIRKMTEWNDEASSNLNQLLRDWLIDHVIKEDLLMKPFFKKFPNNYNPWNLSKLK